MNKGERDEILIKFYLAYLRDKNKEWLKGIINSVGFNDIEYKELPIDSLDEILNYSDSELLDLAIQVGITKSSPSSKSDVYINKIGYSLKSQSAAPPALVNHTTRPGFERVCNIVGVDISELDEVINQYWDLREKNIIREDIKNDDKNSPFKNRKDILKPILEYFLFSGTGSRNSTHPAKYILTFSNPFDMNTWEVLTPSESVDQLWDKLVFSVRAKKGMPYNYDLQTYSGRNAQSIAKWVRYHSGDYRGALHIRSTR